MSDLTQVLGIVVKVDGTLELTNGMKLSAEQTGKLGQQLDQLGKAQQTAGAGGKANAEAQARVASTAADAARSAAQLGQQLAQGNMAAAAKDAAELALQHRALFASAGLVTGALSGVAAAGVLVTIGYFQIRRELDAFTRGLVTTGGYIGYNADQLQTMAIRIDQVAGTRAAASEALAAIAEGGRIAGAQVENIANAAIAMNRAVGAPLQKTIGEFESLARAPSQAVAELNSRYHFLTSSVYAQIVALEAQGRRQQAAELAERTYADAVRTRAREIETQLGVVERAWRGLKDAAKESWDAMLNIGRPQTLEQRLAEATARRVRAETALGIQDRGGRRQSTKEAELQAARDAESLLQSELLMQRRAATQRSEAEQQTAKEIEAAGRSHQEALAGVERAGAALRLAQAGVDLEARRAQLDKAFRQDEIRAKDYQAKLLEIDLAATYAQEEAVKRQIAAAGSVKPRTPDESLAQRAAIIQLEAQRVQIQQQRVKLLAEEQSGARDIAPKAYSTGPSDALNKFRGEDNSAVDDYVRAQRQAREQAAQDVLQINRQLTIELIQDDRARGEAQIAADAETLRRRLDLESLTGEERKRVENDFATWRVLRERQLTEQLKPEWQRMLDQWADTARLQRDAYDGAMTGILRTGEDAFIELSRSGKLNARNMVDGILVELARLEYRKRVAKPLSDLVGSFLDAVLGASLSIDTSGYSATGGAGYSNQAGISGGRAAGGPVSAGRLYQVNERGPELLQQGGKTYLMMGASDGRVIPNQALAGAAGGGAAGGGVASVQVSITNKGQPVSATAQASRAASGALQIDVLLDAIDDGMADRIATGRGSTYAAIGGRFGLRPALN